MLKAFNKKNQLFPELNPSERIPKLIREHIFPKLEKSGFKLLKSGLSIKQKNTSFQQEIWFSKSKWNTVNDTCAFTPHFKITIINYNKWCKNQYGKKPISDTLEELTANYIAGWSNELFNNDKYDLATDDNEKIVDVLNTNMVKAGLKFLNTLSEYSSAVDFLMKEERYFIAPKMIDICLMSNDSKKASMVLDWFRAYEQTGESEFMETTLDDIKERAQVLKGT